MIKITPDPPAYFPRRRLVALLQTVNAELLQNLKRQPSEPPLLQALKATVANPNRLGWGAHRQLFEVAQGVDAEQALLHVSLLLRCAEEVCDEISEAGSGVEAGLIWSMIHSVEMARAVVDALLKGAAESLPAR